MFFGTVEKRLDSIVDECQRANSCALIIGSIIVVIEFQTRTVHHQNVWMSKSIQVLTLSDGAAAFPGLFVAPGVQDKRFYALYEMRGVGLVAQGVTFDPQNHRMAKHFFVSKTQSEAWDVANAVPFWEEHLLQEVRAHLAAMPKQPASTEALGILDVLIDQVFPSQPTYMSGGTDPQLSVYTMRQLPTGSRISTHKRPAVQTKDSSLLHVINCCEHVQNTSCIQLVFNQTNTTLVKTNKWSVDEAEVLGDKHALPELLWVQKRPLINADELDKDGFGLCFSDDRDASTMRQRTIGFFQRMSKGTNSRCSMPKSLAEVGACMGEFPALFGQLAEAIQDYDSLCARFLRRLHSGIESSKRAAERKEKGKQTILLRDIQVNVWTLAKPAS